jgi:adenine deaminase
VLGQPPLLAVNVFPSRVQRAQHDRGGAVLGIVEDRHLQSIPQLAFLVEAMRCGHVIQAHRAELASNGTDARDHIRHVTGIAAGWQAA